MLQGWRDLASLHWPYDSAEVQRLLPAGLRVDTYDGTAWVGLIPFRMERVRLPGFPALGPLSTFPETNVRTYVVDGRGRRAVWFMSLDVTRLLPALTARVSYRLPYCWSRMRIEHDRPSDGDGEDHGVGGGERVWTYTSARRWPRSAIATSRLAVRVGPAIAPDEITPFEHFVTGRWALASRVGRRLGWAEVDHPAWTLHRAELIDEIDAGLVVAAGLPAPSGTPVVLWSPGVEVRIGRPRLLPPHDRLRSDA